MLDRRIFYDPGSELRCGEDDCDGLRALFHQTSVKEELCDHCDGIGPRQIEEAMVLDVWCLQQTIAPRFKDGRLLHQLIALLKIEPVLMLRGILACVHCPTGGRVRRFYTFDHRRLWCMHMAGCPMLRVEVVLSGPIIDEGMAS